MSSDINTDIDRPELRRTIRSCIKTTETISRDTLLDDVATEAGVPADAVRKEINVLERSGFVYMVGDEDPEVRIP